MVTVTGRVWPGCTVAEVGENVIVPAADLLDVVDQQSGEGRFRWWHARHGGTAELATAASDRYGDVAWVVTKEQVIAGLTE